MKFIYNNSNKFQISSVILSFFNVYLKFSIIKLRHGQDLGLLKTISKNCFQYNTYYILIYTEANDIRLNYIQQIITI